MRPRRILLALRSRWVLVTRLGPAYLLYLLFRVYLPKGVFRFRHLRRANGLRPTDADNPRETLPSDGILALEAELDRLHIAGVTGVDFTPGNVRVMNSNKVIALRQYRDAVVHTTRNTAFFLARDLDRARFNSLYDRDLMTEATARDALRSATSRPNAEAPRSEWYGAIDFGHGLTVGQVWSTDTGTGRWRFLNSKVLTPLVAGNRVLDLGSNNGVQPLMMLRAGAREVIGLEYSAEHVAAAKVVHRIFEWRDLRRYPFTLLHRNMVAILTEDLGEFDVVTALCSLYYLPPDSMRQVVQRVAELAPTMVLQANVETAPEQALDSRSGVSRSSVDFLYDLLRDNGFPDIDIHAPANFSRPLLVGRT